MKIFISWSGPRSRYIAEALYKWLPNVIQSLSPFVSSQSIAKGDRGTVVIASELESATVGIVCLTPENRQSTWIHFEAGALSKFRTAALCTYIHELQPSDVEPPLSQFQHSRTDKRDTESLVEAINSRLEGERQLDAIRLHDSFEAWWPKLEEQLKNVPPRPEDEKEPKPRSDENKLDEALDILRRIAAPPVPTSSAWKRYTTDATLMEAIFGKTSAATDLLDQAIFFAARSYLNRLPSEVQRALLNDADFSPSFVHHIMEHLRVHGIPAERQDVQVRLRRVIERDGGRFLLGGDPSN
jgi:hypothetical protein